MDLTRDADTDRDCSWPGREINKRSMGHPLCNGPIGRAQRDEYIMEGKCHVDLLLHFRCPRFDREDDAVVEACKMVR